MPRRIPERLSATWAGPPSTQNGAHGPARFSGSVGQGSAEANLRGDRPQRGPRPPGQEVLQVGHLVDSAVAPRFPINNFILYVQEVATPFYSGNLLHKLGQYFPDI